MLSLRFDRTALTQYWYPTYCPDVLWHSTNYQVLHLQHIAHRVLFLLDVFFVSVSSIVTVFCGKRLLVLCAWQSNFVNVGQIMVRVRGLISWYKFYWWFYGFFHWQLGQVTLKSGCTTFGTFTIARLGETVTELLLTLCSLYFLLVWSYNNSFSNLE